MEVRDDSADGTVKGDRHAEPSESWESAVPRRNIDTLNIVRANATFEVDGIGARREFNSSAVGRPLANDATGTIWYASVESFNKMTAARNKLGPKAFRRQRVIAVQHLEALIQAANLEAIREDQEQDPQVKQIYEFQVLFEVEGAQYRVRLLGKEFKQQQTNSASRYKMHSLAILSEIQSPATEGFGTAGLARPGTLPDHDGANATRDIVHQDGKPVEHSEGQSADPDYPEPKPECEQFMRLAIEAAREAERLGDIPIGCVIVHEGEVIAIAHNRREIDEDPLAHAEVLAIKQAAHVMGSWRLENTALYVTLEPCPMCAGAIILSRVPEVYFGAMDPKAGCAGSLMNLLADDRFNHRPRVVPGILAEECGAMLSDFFRVVRSRQKESKAKSAPAPLLPTPPSS